MGRGGFRAGVARNMAATHSRGEILLFLDSDILIPRKLLHELIRRHEEYDLIQATRVQLRQTAPPAEPLFY
jgi:glycosyltransferase involved in cell wall biosynthesis